MKTSQRRAPGAGHVFRRGKGYCVRWTRDKQTMVRALRDADGNPIRRREEADRAAAEMLRPWTAAKRADTLAELSAAADRARTEADELMAKASPPPGIEAAWTRFDASPGRPDCGPNTLAGYAAHFEDFMGWLTRKRPTVTHLHEVTNGVAAAYAADLVARKLAPSTFNQRVNLLSMLWGVLAEDFQLAVNPWTRERIARKKLQPLTVRKKALTPGQFAAVLAAAEADPEARDLLTLLGWTGLRLADAVLLRWSAVDFETRVLTVAPIKTVRRSGKTIRVPLFPAALAVLNQRQSGRVLDGRTYVFPKLAADYRRDRSAVQKRLRVFFEKAGLTTSEERADRARAVVTFGVHSLRHTFATQAAAAGIPEYVIRDILGHESERMTAHYQHVDADLVAKLAANLGSDTPALPAPADPMAKLRAKVRDLAGQLPERGKTGRIRADILALCAEDKAGPQNPR